MARKNAVLASDAAYKPRPPAHERKSGPFDEYEIESACDTLVRAMRIKKNPALLRACKKHAQQEHAALTKATAR